MTKRYFVSVPILAIAKVEVEADNEEDAIAYALDRATLENVDEWEAHKKLVQGNCFYGDLSEAEVTGEESL